MLKESCWANWKRRLLGEKNWINQKMWARQKLDKPKMQSIKKLDQPKNTVLSRNWINEKLIVIFARHRLTSLSWVGECLNIDVLSNADNLRLPIILPRATSLSLPKKETLWILLSKQHKLNSVLNQIPRYPELQHCKTWSLSKLLSGANFQRISTL